MTVPPDDPAELDQNWSRQTIFEIRRAGRRAVGPGRAHDRLRTSRAREPRAGPAAWRSPFGFIVWAIYFVALIVACLMSVIRHIGAVEGTTVWGLSIALAIALLVFPIAVERAELRAGSRPQVKRGLLAAARHELAWPQPTPPGLAATAMLVGIGSVAISWAAVEVTLAGDPAGVWTMALPGAAAAALVLTGLGSSRAEVQPPGKVLALPSLAPETPIAADEGGILTRVRPAGLVRPDWSSQLHEPFPAVVIDSGFWRSTMPALATRTTEVGGVVLITRSQGILVILGAIFFPSQGTQSSTRCEFPTVEIDRLRDVLDAVSPELGIEPGDVAVTWAHTHPGMGLFLSATDVATSREWRLLDPDFTPIVIDPRARELDDQIGVFDSKGKLMAPMRLVDLADVGAMRRLGEAVLNRYKAAGGPEPLVLLCGISG